MDAGSSSAFGAGAGGGDGALSSSGVEDGGTSAKKKNTSMARESHATHCSSQIKESGTGWDKHVGDF